MTQRQENWNDVRLLSITYKQDNSRAAFSKKENANQRHYLQPIYKNTILNMLTYGTMYTCALPKEST